MCVMLFRFPVLPRMLSFNTVCSMQLAAGNTYKKTYRFKRNQIVYFVFFVRIRFSMTHA